MKKYDGETVQISLDNEQVEEDFEFPTTCKMCGAHLSPFMGKECMVKSVCQNCLILLDMEEKGILAKNGLSIVDLM